MTQVEQPHTELAESIRALGTQVQAVRRRLAALEVPAADDAEALATATSALEAAAQNLSEGHAKLEAEMETLRELIELERLRYRDLFEWAPEAYLVTDASGTILEANRAAEKLFRFDRRLLLGTSITQFLPLEERRAFGSMLDRLPTLEMVADWELYLVRLTARPSRPR